MSVGTVQKHPICLDPSTFAASTQRQVTFPNRQFYLPRRDSSCQKVIMEVRRCKDERLHMLGGDYVEPWQIDQACKNGLFSPEERWFGLDIANSRRSISYVLVGQDNRWVQGSISFRLMEPDQIFIDELASAPWNRVRDLATKDKSCPPVKRIGSALIAAVLMSYFDHCPQNTQTEKIVVTAGQTNEGVIKLFTHIGMQNTFGTLWGFTGKKANRFMTRFLDEAKQ